MSRPRPRNDGPSHEPSLAANGPPRGNRSDGHPSNIVPQQNPYAQPPSPHVYQQAYPVPPYYYDPRMAAYPPQPFYSQPGWFQQLQQDTRVNQTGTMMYPGIPQPGPYSTIPSQMHPEYYAPHDWHQAPHSQIQRPSADPSASILQRAYAMDPSSKNSGPMTTSERYAIYRAGPGTENRTGAEYKPYGLKEWAEQRKKDREMKLATGLGPRKIDEGLKAAHDKMARMNEYSRKVEKLREDATTRSTSSSKASS